MDGIKLGESACSYMIIKKIVVQSLSSRIILLGMIVIIREIVAIDTYLSLDLYIDQQYLACQPCRHVNPDFKIYP